MCNAQNPLALQAKLESQKFFILWVYSLCKTQFIDQSKELDSEYIFTCQATVLDWNMK